MGAQVSLLKCGVITPLYFTCTPSEGMDMSFISFSIINEGVINEQGIRAVCMTHMPFKALFISEVLLHNMQACSCVVFVPCFPAPLTISIVP